MDKPTVSNLLVSLAICTISAYAFGEALTFPLLSDYAGVQGKFYVSPALLPIVLSSLIFVLSGWYAWTVGKQLSRAPGLGAACRAAWRVTQLDLPLAFAMFAIGTYTLLLIPNIDFIVCSTIAIFTLQAFFHLRSVAIRSMVLGAYGAVVLLTGLALALPESGFMSSDAAREATLALTLLVSVGVGVAASPSVRSHLRQLASLLCIAGVSSVCIYLVFGRAFEIPFPHEGATVQYLSDLVDQAF